MSEDEIHQTPAFAFQHIQLAEMPYEDIPGTPSGVLVLRAMKAERLGDLLGDPLWDESLILAVPREVFQPCSGRVIGRQEDVIEALTVRFGSVPEGLREEILAVADEERLREMLRSAILCESIEAFATSI